MKTLTEKQKKQLKKDYQDAKRSERNLLEWCAEKSREYGMSYGQFVTLLRI